MSTKQTIAEFFFDLAEGLRSGDHFHPGITLERLEEVRDLLEGSAAELEAQPKLAGMEAVYEAQYEALELFQEASDLAELAILEEIPELGADISRVTQDAIDILRYCRQQVQSQADIVNEEYAQKG